MDSRPFSHEICGAMMERSDLGRAADTHSSRRFAFFLGPVGGRALKPSCFERVWGFAFRKQIVWIICRSPHQGQMLGPGALDQRAEGARPCLQATARFFPRGSGPLGDDLRQGKKKPPGSTPPRQERTSFAQGECRDQRWGHSVLSRLFFVARAGPWGWAGKPRNSRSRWRGGGAQAACGQCASQVGFSFSG